MESSNRNHQMIDQTFIYEIRFNKTVFFYKKSSKLEFQSLKTDNLKSMGSDQFVNDILNVILIKSFY